MMQFMRHLAQSWFFKGLMLLLVISFGIWGIGDMFRGNPMTRVVARTGTKEVTVQELSRTFEHNLIQARQNFGPELTPQQAKDFGLLDMTLNGLIEKALLAQETKKLGIDLSENTILDYFTVVPQFRDKDGKFNKELIRNLLNRANLSERDFVVTQREENARRLLLETFESKAALPDSIVNAVTSARGQKRILDVITLKNDTDAKIPTPDDKELNSFYEKNPKQFTAPEYRAVTIALLTTDAITKDAAISDDDLHKAYEAKSAPLEHGELRSFLQVVTQNEAKAKQLAEAANILGDLAKAAKHLKLDAVSIDDTDKKSFLPELADTAFTMKERQISDATKTSLGWHVIQLVKITPAGKPSFESMQDELRNDIRHDQAIESTTRIVNQLDDELAAGHSLDDIADTLKLRLIKIPKIDAKGKTPDGSAANELPVADETLKAAFGQNSGETSPVIDDKKGNYVVVRTDDITPSAVKPFAACRDDVAKAWKVQAAEGRAHAEAEKIAQDIRSGKAVSSIALHDGLEIHESRPVSEIGDEDPEFPPVLVPNILKMKKGDVVSWPLPGRQMIVHLARLDPVDLAHDEQAKGRVLAELNDQMPKELGMSYLKYLRGEFPVTIRQDLVDQIVQPQGN